MKRSFKIALSTAVWLGSIAAFFHLTGLSLIPLMLWMFFTQALPPGCEQRKELASAVSPDGAWVASITDNICSDGLFVTTYTDEVELRRSDEPMAPFPSRQGVFALDNAGSPREPLAVTWLGPRSLEITIPNEAWIGRQETGFRGVTISYRYVPDDPLQRACAKQLHALIADERFRTKNLTRAEFFARCRAASEQPTDRR
jgi:hypothetical protein